jgi:hypothetical protein
MSNPVWVTRTGSLGNQNVLTPLQIYLYAYPVQPATTLTFILVSGLLPYGLTLSSNGIITGSPLAITAGLQYSFTIRATDNLGKFTDRTFTMKIIGDAPPIWNTPSGSLGVYPATIPLTINFSATAQLPAVNVFYSIISGNIPEGLTLSTEGLLSGTPSINSATSNQNYTFVIRAIDNLQHVNDRTFSLTITGDIIPQLTPFDTLSFLDSTWIEFAIPYTNPVTTNKVTLSLAEGLLPPGLEINPNGNGLIRGYPAPPTVNRNLPEVKSLAISTTSSTNTINVTDIDGFIVGRPVIFTGETILGGLIADTIYYVKDVNILSFTISATQDGPDIALSDEIGFMDIVLPTTTQNEPIVKTFNFAIRLQSDLGDDLRQYAIIVENRNAPDVGAGLASPTIYNTRPPTFDYLSLPQDFGYFVLPPPDLVSLEGQTYLPNQTAFIGNFLSDNIINFKIIGHDFNNDTLEYQLGSAPAFLSLDTVTGWINGIPMIPIGTINQFTFQVTVRKVNDPGSATLFNFGFTVSNEIDPTITWLTTQNIGKINNATKSTLKIQALSQVELTYELLQGELPPNLILNSNGDILGTTAFQPGTTIVDPNESTTFTFTVQAYNVENPLITSTRTFTLDVVQEFPDPTDNLYIKCTPGFEDRAIIDNLLNDENLIPNYFLYRPEDLNFGKAQSVVYAHAYGIDASQFPEYVAAVTKNHYWRNIILGEIETAVAKDEQGNIIYEVVYSKVVDNLVNPENISISKEIVWPTFINLGIGPYYTSITDIYTSYEFDRNQNLLTTYLRKKLLTQNLVEILTNQGDPRFYTSLTPGYVKTLYPNSLPNMREQVGNILGQQLDYKLLPAWMTSQQPNGSTLGFTPAWVIAYVKPRQSYTTIATQTIAVDNIVTVESTEGFIVGKPIIFTGNTFGNIFNNETYYVKEIVSETEIKISQTVNGDVYTLLTSSGRMSAKFLEISYSDIIKENIENLWSYKLNQIDFKIDRFSVDKSLTYNYDNSTTPPSWTGLPSGTPVPDPQDSKDFYVLFPRKTILPKDPQYY